MKKLTIFLLIALSINVYGQDNQEVELKWIININEKLTYQTIIEQVDTSYIKTNVTLADIISPDQTTKDLIKGEEEKALGDIDEFMEEMKKIYGNTKFVTYLTSKKKDIIDIITEIVPDKPLSTEEIEKMDEKEQEIYTRRMAHQSQRVVFRGSIYPDGEIESFWLKTDQKNILSLLYKLPDKPVKIGDFWSVNVSLINGDQNFICDSSYIKNKVTLDDIKNIGNDQIATIKYNIIQYAHGKYKAPLFGGIKESEIKGEYYAIAKFSVTRGKWISYEGLMTYSMSGIKEGKLYTRYALYEQK